MNTPYGGSLVNLLIDAARAKRDSKIDAQAAQTQADVEQAEKDYDARKQAEKDAAAGAGQSGGK